jgi:hypothetical protein
VLADVTSELKTTSQATTTAAPTNSSAGEANAAAHRLREGTQFTNRIGRFRVSGDSLTFIDESNREIGGLPNLNLERIIRMLKAVDEPENVRWSVSGVITEFSDRNYLLISRAVYKAAAPPPPPESLSSDAKPAPPERLAP